jgi:AraC-like DNA-binding protein
MYLEHLRIARAKELLAIGVPLVDAARSTGFGDQSHFTRRFKQVVGLPPGRYARQVLGN